MAMDHQKKVINVDKETKTTIAATKIRLRPIGFPIRSNDEEGAHLTTDDPKLFEQYARSQWVGITVNNGDFLFDTIILPDFAFLVESVTPNPSKITKETVIDLLIDASKDISNRRGSLLAPITFSDIIGQQEAKRKCKIILKFLGNPDLFTSNWAPKNILFYGPPGTGKTFMAKALAHESKTNIFLMKASDLLGVFVGDGARRIKKLYTQARKHAPSIVFIDEIDAIGLGRKYQDIRGDVIEVVSALLGEMDGVDANLGVITIGATNQPVLLDDAIKSRFEELINFKLPSLQERSEILKHYASSSPIPFTKNINWATIAQETHNWSGRDLKEKVIKVCIHDALLSENKIITLNDLLHAIKKSPNFNEKLPHYV